MSKTTNIFNGFRNAPPRADTTFESLRGLGYSTATAIADIIDNSIAAGASEIDIKFHWAEHESYISILDNGNGMSDNELESAMTIGVRSPSSLRAVQDLGRFGLGLKTASISQCKRLTVASKKNNSVSCLRWDLDVLASDPNLGWALLEGAAHSSAYLIDSLSNIDHGTLVIWESLDKIITSRYTADDFLQLIELNVVPHLSMVFHRIIFDKSKVLSIKVNGVELIGWDPFLLGHPSKAWTSPVQQQMTQNGPVQIQCHVLPHKDKLTAEQYDVFGGPEGWNTQQGFYVYRNRRLLVAGGWLGLGHPRAWNREEPYKLARIRLDITNSADDDWKIDVRKSTARPPRALRPWLTQIASDTRSRAKSVFAHRGTPQSRPNTGPQFLAWTAKHLKGGIRYEIDLNHPAISAVMDQAGELKVAIKAMLRVIEETVPVERIWLDTTENSEPPQTNFRSESEETVSEISEILFLDLIERKGLSENDAKDVLLRTDPFQNFPVIINALRRK
jgi:hypothetical protein